MDLDTLSPHHHDLVSPDGKIQSLEVIDPHRSLATVCIESISSLFVGFQIEKELVSFNLKSTLAQLGLHTQVLDYQLDASKKRAEVHLHLLALSPLGACMLSLLKPGMFLGKLFAADERRKVRNPDYLMRLFGRSDKKGRPLLSLGGLEGSGALILEKLEERTVAFLALQSGILTYDAGIHGLLPTLANALIHNLPHTRQLLTLHHEWQKQIPCSVRPGEMLLVRTAPLHIRTVYARVVDTLLPQGFHHTSANVLQPDTSASGDIYELYGNSLQTLSDIPIEFYTLEPYREHVFFSDRDQLMASLEDPKVFFEAFRTAPQPAEHLASTFVVKGSQLKALTSSDWILTDPFKHEFPGLSHPSRQALMVEKYIEEQPAYPFLKAMEQGAITSQGILLCRYFPTPLLKRTLLNDLVTTYLRRIYFQFPSLSHGSFFSQEDRALLFDLAKFGIPVYWVDEQLQCILQYVLRSDKDAGLFVPLALVDIFRKATFFGVYGSNLIEGIFEEELKRLLQGVLHLRSQVNHPLLSQSTPLALMTGGGPGAMEVGNRVAKTVGILSCANLVDFRPTDRSVVNEQKQNPYVDAKMTYRLDRLVERQAEFYLDFPIFLPGGIGMDFEYTLEEVRRKTGGVPPNPVLLFGELSYWKEKISHRFRLNCKTGTIRGSEWISNCFYCVQTADQGLKIYQRFFENRLPIGKQGPVYEAGFCESPDQIPQNP